MEIEQNTRVSRIVVVGSGPVGATFAYALMITGLVSEIALIDVNRERARGEAMDLNHGLSFVRPVRIWDGDYADCARADVVVVAAGAAQRPGESRLDLVQRNVAILRDVVTQVTRHADERALLLVVANPVDVLAYAAWKLSGWPSQRVLGSGTVLDTSRFRLLLSQHFLVDPRSVHAYIVGEHGDSEIPLWSTANIGGVPLAEFEGWNRNAMDDIFAQTRQAAYAIIQAKGATYYAIGLSLVRIVEAIIHDQHSVLSVSTLMQGDYGLNDVYLSLPAIVARRGVERVLDVPLSQDEVVGLHRSAGVLRDTIAKAGL
jgi:L-lactate dehydrogenase